MPTRAERGVALFFLAGVVGGIAPFVFASGYPLSTRVAAAGGTLAAVGAVAIFRPLVRGGGPFTYAVVEVFGDLVKRGDMKDAQLEKYIRRLEEKDELLMDRFLERQLGPMFVAIGTIINGYSGFFS